MRGSPRKTNVQLRAARDDEAPHGSMRPGLLWQPLDDGAVSEVFEIWLSPPLVTAFAGHPGRLEATVLSEGVTLCSAAVEVRYVDQQVCMHYEDGSLDCTGAKKGVTPP